MADTGGRSLVFGGRSDGRGPFHAYDGWYFQRDDDGQVLVQHRVKDGEGWAADASVIFDPATWTSIVTAVSAFPDDSATHAGAVALHAHSQKPAAFFDLVESWSPGPYVELFASAPRLGWDAWGRGYESEVA